MLNVKLDFNIQEVISLSIKVNNLLLSYYNSEFKISHKSDDSPVTDADHSASELIIEQLHQITPGVSVVSEENDLSENLDIIKEKSIFWLIDPLDGTSSFISKRGIFTVNIALIVNGIAVWGLISSPLDGIIYYNDLPSTAVYKFDGENSSIVKPKAISNNAVDFLVSHQNLNQNTQDFITHFKINTITPIPSAIKFALLAEGKGDIYPRYKDTCIWDTAAGQALLNAVGGDVVTVEGKSLRYNFPTVKNPHFIAVSNIKLIDLFINKL